MEKMRWFAALALSAALSAAQPDRMIAYKAVEGDDLQLDVFFPEDWSASDRRPAIVLYFGGGWVGGDTAQFHPQAEVMARWGLVAISAQYRTRNLHGTDPFTAVADGKSALRWVRAHAAELGVDADRIIASGRSAGGHVAACAAMLDGFNDAADDLSVSPVPQALVLFNPVLDTTERGYGTEKVGERKTDASPTHHVRPGLPPTLVMHGTADTVVPHENAERFCRLMREAGNRCELESYADQIHGFFQHERGEEFFRKTLDRTERFLRELGYIAAP